MNPSSQTPDERARKNYAIFLQQLASVGQKAVADDIGVHESTVSRRKSDGDYEEFCRTAARVGLKIVPEGMKCFNPKDIDAILHQAKCWLAHIESSEQLWEQE